MKTRPKYQCSITGRLDGVRMTPAERLAAKTYLQRGVVIVDTACQIGAWMRSVLDQVRRGVRGLARDAR